MAREWKGNMDGIDDFDDVNMFEGIDEDDDDDDIEMDDEEEDILSSSSFMSQTGPMKSSQSSMNSGMKSSMNQPDKKLPKKGEKIEEGKVKDFKKTGFMLLLIGLGILIVAVVGIRLIKSAQSSKSVVSSTKTASQNEKKNVSSQKTNSKQENNSSQLLPSANSWVEVDLSNENLGFSDTYIESDFTITGMKDYAVVTNSSNDKQLKTVATGNISGLVGTYEIILPTSKAHKLTIGQKFKVKYELTEYNGYKLIGEIKY